MNMYSNRRTLPLVLVLGSAVFAAGELPTEWIDASTGHRVIRLSREDGTQSLYFNQNAYTADGKKLIVTTAGGGIATINLATRDVAPLVAGPVSVLVAGHKTGDVYYTRRVPGGQAGAIVYAANVDTGATREVVKLPPGRNVASLNADETLLLGTYVDSAATPAPAANLPARDPRFGCTNDLHPVVDGANCRFRRNGLHKRGRLRHRRRRRPSFRRRRIEKLLRHPEGVCPAVGNQHALFDRPGIHARLGLTGGHQRGAVRPGIRGRHCPQFRWGVRGSVRRGRLKRLRGISGRVRSDVDDHWPSRERRQHWFAGDRQRRHLHRK